MINVSSSPGRNNDNSDDRYQRRDCLIDALLEMIKKCRLINGIHQQPLQVLLYEIVKAGHGTTTFFYDILKIHLIWEPCSLGRAHFQHKAAESLQPRILWRYSEQSDWNQMITMKIFNNHNHYSFDAQVVTEAKYFTRFDLLEIWTQSVRGKNN